MQFRRPHTRSPALGALEIAVLRELWARADRGDTAGVDPRGMLESLAARRISLSTIQATLERLHRKELLVRTKTGRAYYYLTGVSRSRLIGSLIRNLTEQLAAGELEPVIAGFVELVGDASPELLDTLEAQAALERRKERK